MQTDDMNIYNFLIAVLQFAFVLALVFAFYWTVDRRRNAASRARIARSETLGKLLEKFSSGQEAAEFLKSPEGHSLLDDHPRRASRTNLLTLGVVQAGVVFLFVGLGSYLNAYLLRNETDLNYIREVKEIQFWGTLAIAIGAGLLFTAFLTRFLVRRWGLNGEKNAPVH